MMPAQQLIDAARRLSAARWSWSVADIGEVAAQLGWTVDQPAAHGVAYLRTGYESPRGLAFITYRDETAQSAVVPLTDRLERRFPDRIGAFAAAVATVTSGLGAPQGRRPGERPKVWWAAVDGLVEVGDDGAYIGLEWRSARFEAELAAGRERTHREREFKALNPNWDRDDEDDILSRDPPF